MVSASPGVAKHGRKTSAHDRAVTVSEQVDRELVTAALRKREAGQQPSLREMSALRRYERQRDEQLRWDHYRTIPQKHWREMSGRQRTQIVEQAVRYGIPFGGKTIDLPAVVAALHTFLAANAGKLLAADADPLMQGSGSSPALERYREARAGKAELELLELQGEYVRWPAMRDGFLAGFITIRHFTERMQRDCTF